MEKTPCFWKRNAFLLESALLPNLSIIVKPLNQKTSANKKNIFKQTIPKPCEIVHFDSKPLVIPNLHRHKANRRFKLQSAPNMHRDKTNKSFELQSAPNLHRDKKQKFWTSKRTTPAQGQKRRNFTIYLGRGDYPSKVFVVFCPCAGLMHFEVQNPMHSFICVLILFVLFADFLHAYGIFCLQCSFLKGQVHFSCKRVYNLKKKWPFSKTDSVFRILLFFPFEMSIYFKSYVFRL